MAQRAYIGPRLGRRYHPRRIGSGMITPASLGAALKLWLRADLGVSTVGSNVSSWTDQSASGAIWDGPVGQWPQFTADAINGQPGITFAAAGQAMDIRSGSVAVAAPWTWLAVFKSTVAAGTYGASGYAVLVTGATTGCTFQHSSADHGFLYTYTGPIGNDISAPDATVAAGVIGRLSSSGVTPQEAIASEVGGVTGSDVTLTLTGVGSKVGLISAGGGALTICELIVVDGASTEARLRPYLLARYNLSIL